MQKRAAWCGLASLLLFVVPSIRCVGVVAFFGAWLVFAFAHLDLITEDCPRCLEPLFRRPWFFSNTFSETCLHCGVRIAPPDASPPRGG